MSALSLSIQIDTKAFEDRLANMAKSFPAAMASGVTTSARAGRRAFLKETIVDAIGGGIGDRSSAVGRIKEAVRRIVPANASNLTAVMVIPPPGGKYGVVPIVRSMTAGNQYKPGGGTISTDTITGGPSSNLSSTKFFTIKSNGGQVVLARTKSVKGLSRAGGSRRLTSGSIKKVFAETVSAAMKQDDAAPRKVWERTINATLSTLIAAALQTVMNGAAAPAASGAEE